MAFKIPVPNSQRTLCFHCNTNQLMAFTEQPVLLRYSVTQEAHCDDRRQSITWHSDVSLLLHKAQDNVRRFPPPTALCSTICKTDFLPTGALCSCNDA